MRYLCLFIIFLSLLVDYSHALEKNPETTQYRYNEVTGDLHEQFLWSMISGSKVQLSSKKDREETSLICKPNGEVIQWQQQDDKGTFITATRSENILSLEGKMNNKGIKDEFKLDDKPWFQFLSFSLQPFLQDSASNSVVFWMLRQDTLEPVLMEATKVGTEIIELHDQNVETEKIKIAAQGFSGKFWHAHYWYRLPDYLFVMYRGTHGGPLTPETIMTLDQ